MLHENRIKELRKEKNITVAELAARLNKAESTVRMWETGKSTPTQRGLLELASIFECSIDYILCFSSEKTGSDTLKERVKYNIYMSSHDAFMDVIQKLEETDRETITYNINAVLETINKYSSLLSKDSVLPNLFLILEIYVRLLSEAASFIETSKKGESFYLHEVVSSMTSLSVWKEALISTANRQYTEILLDLFENLPLDEEHKKTLKTCLIDMPIFNRPYEFSNLKQLRLK